jgi:glycosyltransferase involved in cell wall biosynthesis
MPSALFVHNSFPGQFGAVARALITRGWSCAAITEHAPAAPIVETVQYRVARGGTPDIYTPAMQAEADMIRGAHAAEAALALRNSGFVPDVIIGHPGWGETLFLPEVFPAARTIVYAEYYYNPRGGDADFDPEFYVPSTGFDLVVRAKSATLCLAYCQADALVAPTTFQASRLPLPLRDRAHIIHEGVDTEDLQPRAQARLDLPDGRYLDGAMPVITFVSRTLEPYRGFHRFMRALPEVLAACPLAHAVIMGQAEGPAYGQRPTEYKTWKDQLLAEVGATLDLSRVHFLGAVSREFYLNALSVSAAHVYFSYPFVLSWSLIEAMSLGCLIIGSDNPPVTEAIVGGESGMLVDFFDHAGLAHAVKSACLAPEKYQQLRRGARAAAVGRYDQNRVCLPAWLNLIDMQTDIAVS